MHRRWSLLGGMLVYVFTNNAAGQEPILSREVMPSHTTVESHADSSQTSADSTALPRLSISSALQRFRSRLDAGYHSAPLNPYFRDDQRVINDMRRLVFLADKAAVRGVESIPELVDMAQKMSVAKQTMIIRMATAGSVANWTAESIMKRLRQHKLNFVRVEVERVLCQTNWNGTNLSVARSLDRQTYTVGVPKLRTTYSRIYHPRFISHHVNLAPLPRLSLNYIRWDELDIFSAFYALKGGFGLVSHDYTSNVTLLGLRLQEHKNWIGIFFMKNRRVAARDWLHVEAWLTL